MATKLNFRARTLDASKPMSVYHSEDLPDLADLNAINRSVPAMPSGMEKEEEAEKHLQDILESQDKHNSSITEEKAEKKAETAEAAPDPQLLFIPTPDVFVSAADADGTYETIYKNSFKMPRAFIHVQPFSADHDQPDYDMDDEDERFLNHVLREQKKFEVNEVTFEDMLDRLEKNSGHNVVSAKEAKLLLKEDDELILAVYDYWVDKRLRLKQPLIPAVKSDKRDGAAGASSSSGPSGSGGNSSAAGGSSSNPYIAFRRRTEKMQTRKNRKNDEASYEKMLKLRRDLSRAVTLLEMVKRREKTKKENLNLTKDIFEKRFGASDFDGRIISEVLAQRAVHMNQRILQPAMYRYRYAENWVNHGGHPGIPGMAGAAVADPAAPGGRQKRPYTKKKRHKSSQQQQQQLQQHPHRGHHHRGFVPLGNGPEFGTSLGALSSDDEEEGGQEGDLKSAVASPSDLEEELEEGPFAFRRKRNCQYLAPLIDEDGFERFRAWPWEAEEEGGGAEPRFRYSLASLSTPRPRCLGMVRRRVGRGGRIVLDRAFSTDHDDLWRSLGFTVLNGVGRGGGSESNATAAAAAASTTNTTVPDQQQTPMQLSEEDLAVFETFPHYRPVTPPHCREEPDYDPYLLAGSAAAPSPSPSLLGGLLPNQPVKINPSSLATVASPGRQKLAGNGGSMRTVSVDSVIAQNAASAVVNSDTIDLFQTQQQQQQQQAAVH